MTALELYDAGLIELNKVHAPSLLLDDYNYFINKAIQQYANLAYARLEINQQSTDDIRALKKSFTEKLDKVINSGFYYHYRVKLPEDYFHLARICLRNILSDQW